MSLHSAEDLIILDNGQRISGIVISESQAEDNLVTITTGSGLLRIDQRRIKKIIMCYETRRARVKDTDAKGLIELAHWCHGQNMGVEALELLEKALALPGTAGEVQVFYLRLVDEIRGPEAALPLYQNYRNAGGKDEATLQRLEQLEKVKSDWDAVYSNQKAPVIDKTKEGLEARSWMPGAPQYFNPVELQRAFEDNPHGSNAILEVVCKPGKLGKAAVLLGMATSGARYNSLTFTAANASKKPLNVAISIKTGSSYVYHESESIKLDPGGTRQQFTFDLKASKWKSEATGWNNTGAIQDIDQIREIQILLFNGREEYKVYIDDIKFQGVKDL